MEPDLSEILPQFNVDPSGSRLTKIGKGHINRTFRITGEKEYILQQINTSVFTQPEIIENNLREAANFLKDRHPGYNFIAPLRTRDNRGVLIDDEKNVWRLYPYLADTYTIDEADNVDQAYQAAAEFARLAKFLQGCKVHLFHPTINKFHDLAHRFTQFEEAAAGASGDRVHEARGEVGKARAFSFLVDRYSRLIDEKILTIGVFHNDTKINNVLFHEETRRTVAVVDLDTLMPGYFIYDLGDLLRTLVSPVSEEEKDVSKITFRKEFYDSVVNGYLSEMNGLSKDEKKQVPFSGQMMTFIMALRFLADYLRGDTYYHTTYPGQNLVRARNQLRLLELMLENLEEPDHRG